MEKKFVPYNQIRNDAIHLSHKIFSSGFIPDVIYVSLRGGAYLGNIISEYFKLIRAKSERPVFYAAVVAHSYEGIDKKYDIRVDGWTYSPEYLRSGDKVLLVDDVYDSGRTINHLAQIILSKGLPKADVKVAVYDYKEYKYKKNNLSVLPDYWCHKHIIEDHNNNIWIHYMSHELCGLSQVELETHYFPDDPSLRIVLQKNNDAV